MKQESLLEWPPMVRKLMCLAGLDDYDAEEVARRLPGETILRRRGADIISDGETPRYVHMVTSGLACRYKLLDDGRRQITAYLIPGDLCDLHVFILKRMDHAIMALTGTEIVQVPRQNVEALLARPTIATALFKSTLVDEAVLRQWIVNVGRRGAREAIAHLFCELHLRMQVVGLADGDVLQLPITQADLGDTVGLTPVHVNRSLQDLREQGLISLQAGRLSILNPAGLRRLAGFEPDYLHLDDGLRRLAKSSTRPDRHGQYLL